MPVDRLTELARDALGLLADLTEGGHAQLTSTPARSEALMRHVLQESLNILRHEDETVALEKLGGRTAVRHLAELTRAALELPDVELEPTLSQIIDEDRGPLRPIERRSPT